MGFSCLFDRRFPVPQERQLNVPRFFYSNFRAGITDFLKKYYYFVIVSKEDEITNSKDKEPNNMFIPVFIFTPALNRALFGAVDTLEAMINSGAAGEDKNALIEMLEQRNALLELLKVINKT